MSKKNCWELKACGREPGGAKEKELGICPAATLAAANGIHDGKNGGRACWVISGTLCGGKTQGTFATKLSNCTQCAFYETVKKEEGAGFLSAGKIFDRLEQKK